MSYGLRVYLVDAAEIRQFPGKRNKTLLKDILRERSDELADLNENFADVIEDYCPEFSFEQALKEIFTGKFSQTEATFIYGWAFDLLCSFIGQWVHRECDRWSTEWLQTLDKTLASGNVDLQFYGSLVDDCPVKLPENPDGIPAIGHWTHESMMKAITPLDVLGPQVEDKELAHSLAEIRVWLEDASKKPDVILVGVYG